MGEWQPIETAPKDGTDILIGNYYIDDRNGYTGPSRWLWILQGWFEEDGFWNCFIDDEEPLSKNGTWRTPTHWMPLPEPPNPAENPAK